MKNLSETFRAAVQGVKDTINGFDFRSGMGLLHAGATGYMTYQTVGLFLAAGVTGSFLISGLFAAVGFYGAHHNGKQQRMMGLPPRHIR